MSHLQRILDAVDSFFRRKSVEILAPACESLKQELERIGKAKERLDQELKDRREDIRRLKNEIEEAGGERLKQIPLLIQTHESH